MYRDRERQIVYRDRESIETDRQTVYRDRLCAETDINIDIDIC